MAILRILFCIALGLTAAKAAENAASGMRIIGDDARTRFVVDLLKNPDFGLVRLTDPNRLVIDLPDVEFSQRARPGEGRGLISDYRYGLIAPGKARIVLDLAKPVEVVNKFVLDPVEPEPARLVIDLVPTTEAAFEAAARQDRPLLTAGPRPSPVPRRRLGRPVVVLDPGHGGIDSGAVGGDGLLEKGITLKFALEVARQLKLAGKVEPILTRDGDDFLALKERVELAREHHAALFISIHADSVREDYVRGATVYTLSDDASDATAAALAARENRADILAGLAIDTQPDDVADILFDLAMRETRNFSVRFAQTLVGDMKGSLPLNGNPWRRASFLVLKAPDVPSVLLELGYLSNPEDEKLFRGVGWPMTQARAVARSIEAFVGGNVTAGQ
jgi:N-acetylmuramoyl-L-alanine amidase